MKAIKKTFRVFQRTSMTIVYVVEAGTADEALAVVNSGHATVDYEVDCDIEREWTEEVEQ